MLEILYSLVTAQILFGVLMFSIMMLAYIPFNKYLRLESSTSLWFGFFLLLAFPFGFLLEALSPEVVEILIDNSPAVVNGAREKIEATSLYSADSSLYFIWTLGLGISFIFLVLLPLIKYSIFLFKSDFRKKDESIPESFKKMMKDLPVVTSDDTEIKSPFVYGFIFPKICIPTSCIEGLDEKQLEAVLWHEVHHYKNRDNLRNLFCRFVMALFWFFPPVYFVYSVLLKAEEYTADRFAIKKMGSAKVYSETLVNMSGALSVPAQLQTYFFNKQDLKERLFMIKEVKSNSMKLVLTNGAVLLSGLLISCSFVGKEKVLKYDYGIEADITIKRGGKILSQNVLPLNTHGSKVVMFNKPTKDQFSKLELEVIMHSMNMVLLEGTFCEGDHKGQLGLRETEDGVLICGKEGKFQIIAEFDSPAKVETETGLHFDITIKSIAEKSNQRVSSL